jgi:hypothetical protein
LNIIDDLPSHPAERHVTLATKVTSNKPPTSANTTAGTTNLIADTAIADTASSVVDGNQAARTISHRSLELDHSEVKAESNLSDGVARSRRDGDGVANRGVAPAVSSGATPLNPSASGPSSVLQTPAFTQMLRPSDSATHSLQDVSRESESASTSDLKQNTPQVDALTLSDGSPAETNIHHAFNPNSLKVSGVADREAQGVSDRNEALPNASATDVSENANQPDEPSGTIAAVEIQGVRRESADVSAVVFATTQPDTSSIASQVPGSSQVLRQPTHVTGNTRPVGTRDDSSLLATDADAAIVNDYRQVRASSATNDSAASRPKSLDESTNRPASPALDETGSRSSDLAESATHPGRYLTAEAADEAPSLSPPPTSMPGTANVQTESDNPPSYVAMRQVDKTHTPDPTVTFDGIVRADDAPTLGRGAESAPVRLVQEATPAIESGLVANLKVELANGETAQATVRERAGSIDVKIVTPSSTSAQRVSSEIDTMRHNLDAAGMRLGQTEVSYQPGGNGGRGGNQYQRPPQADTSTTDEQIFSISEVNE